MVALAAGEGPDVLALDLGPDLHDQAAALTRAWEERPLLAVRRDLDGLDLLVGAHALHEHLDDLALLDVGRRGRRRCTARAERDRSGRERARRGTESEKLVRNRHASPP